MANVKISALPQVTSVSGSDIIPAVASSATSKITITDLANSLPQVSSSISSSYSNSALTSSFATTSSFAVSASWAPSAGGSQVIQASNTTLFSSASGIEAGPGFSTLNSIFLGYNSGRSAIFADYSNFLGNGAGYQATNANNSNFLGRDSGYQATNAYNSNFLGEGAGYASTNARYSNFFGYNAGANTAGSNNSNFIGNSAGANATNAERSNFIGTETGTNASSASYSTLLGYNVGKNVAGGALGIKSNNIIIGTNITLEDGRTNSINLGGIIFATGSYATTTGNPFSGSMSNARVGINIANPTLATLEVSGSIYASSFTGSLQGTSSWAVSASWAPGGTSGPIAATGSTLYSTSPAAGVPRPSTSNFSIFFGTGSGLGISAGSYSTFLGRETGFSSSADYSNFIGGFAGYKSAGVGNNYIGHAAGYQAKVSDGETTEYANFIGWNAGYTASYAPYSNFIGFEAGYEANNAYSSNFLGATAGTRATFALRSNFLGDTTGYQATSASYSNLLGYRVGYAVTSPGISTNNIIIGTSITLENDRRDSINIGGIIFGTGSYYNTGSGATGMFSGSAGGRIGINVVNPTQVLDVSGSIQISQALILTPVSPLPSPMPTGSIMSSGSGADCKPYFWNGNTWTSLI